MVALRVKYPRGGGRGEFENVERDEGNVERFGSRRLGWKIL